MAELQAMGLSRRQIADGINKEFNTKMDSQVAGRIIQRQSVRKNEFLKSDKEFAEIYKQSLFSLMDKANTNLNILEKTRQVVLERLELIKKDMPESKLFLYFREITNAIRTQNDSIRSMSDLLKHIQAQSVEIKEDRVQSVLQTVQILKDLETEGYITIKPEYYKSELFKEVKKESK